MADHRGIPGRDRQQPAEGDGLRLVEVAGAGPVERGRWLAGSSRDRLIEAIAGYDRLFAAAGLAPSEVAELAAAAGSALRDWAPDLASEIEALADAAGVPGWRVHALDARTELLSAAPAGRECSSVARAGAGVQTWDWHAELAGCWHVLRYSDTALPFVTLTEAGMLAKIGMNAAGVGLLFNILGHRSDTGTGGVAVHSVARRVLDTARDVGEAVAIIGSAPLAASSCFTVLDPDRVACLEATPAGVAEIEPVHGVVVHTNHFLDPRLAAGDTRLGPDSDTLDRMRVLRQRVAGLPAGDLEPDLLCVHEDEGAALCCHAPPAGPLGTRWQTLATVALRPAERQMDVLGGGPCRSRELAWTSLRAGTG